MKANKCSECLRCCHNPTDQEFKIVLTKHEQKVLKMNEILMLPHEKCLFLTDKGCSLNKNRPLICKTFPFIYRHGQIFIDSECPLMLDRKFVQKCSKGISDIMALSKQDRDNISEMRYKKQ